MLKLIKTLVCAAGGVGGKDKTNKKCISNCMHMCVLLLAAKKLSN
jgi:hypothetical protein